MNKRRKQSIRALGAIMALCALSFFPQHCLAENAFLKQGMAEFNAGNYSEASGHFGAALSTEFNSSVLHYYLGNCYVHMKQKESAIREFRIAYALDPDKDVGKYAKQALAGLGADSPGSATGGPGTTSDALAKAAVDKLLDLKSKPGGLTPGPTPTGPITGIPLGVPGLTPKIDDKTIGRGGRLFEPTTTTPTDTASKLEALKRMYEGSRYVPTPRISSEIQRTAENLRELLTKEAKPGEYHLVPAGTNLYIRNYQMAPGAIPTAPVTPPLTPKSSH